MKIQMNWSIEEEDAKRFRDYCSARGFKQNAIVNKLIREHLDIFYDQPAR